MKVFSASYSDTWKFGGYVNKEFIIIATTEGVALGLALEEVKESKREDWTLVEIPLDQEAVHFVSSCGS